MREGTAPPWELPPSRLRERPRRRGVRRRVGYWGRGGSRPPRSGLFPARRGPGECAPRRSPPPVHSGPALRGQYRAGGPARRQSAGPLETEGVGASSRAADAAEVLAGPSIDPDDIAFVEKEGNVDDRTRFEGGR